jgi:hypothetical protein
MSVILWAGSESLSLQRYPCQAGLKKFCARTSSVVLVPTYVLRFLARRAAQGKGVMNVCGIMRAVFLDCAHGRARPEFCEQDTNG